MACFAESDGELVIRGGVGLEVLKAAVEGVGNTVSPTGIVDGEWPDSAISPFSHFFPNTSPTVPDKACRP